MMSGAIIFPPHDKQNDFSILYIETSGCLPMCGHGTIGAVTIAIEEKIVIPKNPGKLNIETPAGLIKVKYELDGDKVNSFAWWAIFKKFKIYWAISGIIGDKLISQIYASN